MRKILIILIIVFMASYSSKSQQFTDKGYVVETRVVNGDTLPHINIREIFVFPPKKFKNAREEKEYYKLVRNVKKVYPYAKLARLKLNQINKKLATFTDEKEKKKYIEKADKALKSEFEAELKNLSMNQGKLLIKLIDRETGNTTFDVIKDLKGSLTAFMWQSVARLFGSNLKSDYDPDGADKDVEEVILRIENGQL